MTPYREAPASEKKPLPTMTLAYAPQGRRDHPAFVSAAFRFAALPAAAFAVVWVAWSEPLASVAAAVLTLAASVWWSRGSSGIVELRIEDGTLHVGRDFSVGLASLRDVVLETKTVERILEGSNAQIGAGFSLGTADQRTAPPTDENRIVLRTDTKSFPLTKTFFGHIDTLEWFGKIRVFLRKAGWEPQSERVDEEEEDDEDEVEEET